jgi:hypothetical protein
MAQGELRFMAMPPPLPFNSTKLNFTMQGFTITTVTMVKHKQITASYLQVL